MTARRDHGEEKGTHEALSFLAFVAAVVGLTVALWSLAGPPTFTSPNVNAIREALTRSELSSSEAISAAGTISWIVLIYLGVTTGLRLAIAIAVRLTNGAAWARGALRLADFATLPPVRRVIDGAVIGLVVITLWARERSGSEAASVSVQPALVAYVPLERGLQLTGESAALAYSHASAVSPQGPDRITYTVSEGDNLWSIARRLYSDGTHYLTLFRANEGQVVAAGVRLENPKSIQAGWSLTVNLPTPNLWTEDDRTLYRVQPGDSLWRIAESFLGSGFKWVEIWDLNQGRTMTDGRPFHDADLILPGWVLQLPVEAVLSPEGAPTETPGATVESPQPPEPQAPQPSPPADVTPPFNIEELPSGDTEEGSGAEVNGDGLDLNLPLPNLQPVLITAAGLAGAVSTYLLVRGAVRRLAQSAATQTVEKKDRAPDGDAGRVVLAARALMKTIESSGFEEARLILVREAARYQDCIIRCAPGDAEALARLQYDLARRLSCGVDTEVISPTEVRVRLSRFQRLAGLLVDREGLSGTLMLVPVGGRDGSVHYLNLGAVGTVLVAGGPEQAEQLLSTWLRTLEATLGAEELIILTSNSLADRVPDIEDSLFIQSDAAETDASLIDELVDMIVAREKSPTVSATPVLALARVEVPELLPGVETVIHHGREQAITVVFAAGENVPLELATMAGATVAFSHSSMAQQVTDWDGEGDLVLQVGRREPVGLFSAEVRKWIVPSAQSGQEDLSVYPGSEAWQFDDPERANPFDEGGMGAASEESWIPDPDTAAEPTAPVDATDADEPSWPDDLSRDQESRGAGDAPGFVPETEHAEGLLDDQDDEGLSRQSQAYVLGLLAPPAPSIKKQLDLGMRNGASVDGTEGDQEAVPLFAIRCFGRFEVAFNGQVVRHWRFTKARELLALLLIHRGEPVTRETAIEALWPDALPEQTEKLLYDAIYHLRATLRNASGAPKQVEFVATPRMWCKALMLYFRLDKDAFDGHLNRAATLERGEALAEYEQGLSLYRAGLFEGEPFDWAAGQRHEYHLRYVQAARRAGQIALDCRDTTRAIDFYQRVLDREPVDEEAARGIMLAYASKADLNGVRKVYRVLCESLRRDLDDEEARPLPDTEALFTKLTSVGP